MTRTFIVAALTAASCFGNPIFDGWYADPQIRRYGDTYWVFPTRSDRFEVQTAFDAFSSKDLKTWTKHANILTTNEVKWARGAMWAPDAHEIDGKYYHFFSANDTYPVGGRREDLEPQKEPGLQRYGGIGVAVADRPEGPYRDLIGKPLIDRFWNRAQPIDQYVFEYKGDWYMIYGGWGRCNLVKLAKDFKSIVPLEDGRMWRDMTPKDYVEGSVMFERRGRWYFMYSSGAWTRDSYCVNYCVGDSPFGPFEFKGKVLGTQRPIATGAGHHSVVCVPGTDEWYICYHRRPIPTKGPHHRVTCIDRMEFDENGDIKPIVMTAPSRGDTVFVEAEAFADKGGWVVDQQFMDQMGSPFLLAHGMGRPVKDAETETSVKGGRYRVFVRTRNWCEEWSGNAEAPGRFLVKVNGKALPSTMGAKGREWAWHEAGTCELAAGAARIALHDLTGFDGRCDAVVLTSDADFTPPNDVRELDALRRRVGAITRAKSEVKADLVVAGGGVAGICAAISAARLGLKVALVNDRPVLGGCNSSEVRVHLGGWTNIGLYPKLGDVVNEIGPAKGGNAKPAAQYEDLRKLDAVRAEKNITLFLDTHVTGVEKKDGRIAALVGRNIETGVETVFRAPLFADCTGDGTVGVMAGAAFRYGREARDETGEKGAVDKADAITMGASVQWYSRAAKAPVPFPDVPWALAFTEKSCEKVKMGEWTWETGMNRDMIGDFEAIRDYGMLVVYSNWAFLKNHSSVKGKYASLKLDWVAYVAGKRESRRLVGDYVMSEKDVVGNVRHPDGTACTTWTIDLHYPDPKNTVNFPGAEFKSIARHTSFLAPYPVPYRCLYSKDVPNLFMAGRHISVTHVALGTVRVMRTLGMLGEVVGMAAKVCMDHECMPRDVYTHHLEELKARMEKGVGTGRAQPPQNYNRGGQWRRK
jgi:hypothetical protein